MARSSITKKKNLQSKTNNNRKIRRIGRSNRSRINRRNSGQRKQRLYYPSLQRAILSNLNAIPKLKVEFENKISYKYSHLQPWQLMVFIEKAYKILSKEFHDFHKYDFWKGNETVYEIFEYMVDQLKRVRTFSGSEIIIETTEDYANWKNCFITEVYTSSAFQVDNMISCPMNHLPYFKENNPLIYDAIADVYAWFIRKAAVPDIEDLDFENLSYSATEGIFNGEIIDGKPKTSDSIFGFMWELYTNEKGIVNTTYRHLLDRKLTVKQFFINKKLLQNHKSPNKATEDFINAIIQCYDFIITWDYTDLNFSKYIFFGDINDDDDEQPRIGPQHFHRFVWEHNDLFEKEVYANIDAMWQQHGYAQPFRFYKNLGETKKSMPNVNLEMPSKKWLYELIECMIALCNTTLSLPKKTLITPNYDYIIKQIDSVKIHSQVDINSIVQRGRKSCQRILNSAAASICYTTGDKPGSDPTAQ
jgi:hypothetical protein